MRLTGGVGIYIKNEITVSVTDQFNFDVQDSEDMWIEFEMKQKLITNTKCILSVIYRHPTSKIKSF